MLLKEIESHIYIYISYYFEKFLLAEKIPNPEGNLYISLSKMDWTYVIYLGNLTYMSFMHFMDGKF